MLIHDARWLGGNLAIERHPHNRVLARLWAYPHDPSREDVTITASPSHPGQITGKPVGKAEFVRERGPNPPSSTGAWHDHRIAVLHALGFRPSPAGQQRIWLLGYRDSTALVTALSALAADDAPWAAPIQIVHWCQARGIPALDYQAAQRAEITEQLVNWRAEIEAFAGVVATEITAVVDESEREAHAKERLRSLQDDGWENDSRDSPTT